MGDRLRAYPYNTPFIRSIHIRVRCTHIAHICASNKKLWRCCARTRRVPHIHTMLMMVRARYIYGDPDPGRIIIYSKLNWNYFYVKTSSFSLKIRSARAHGVRTHGHICDMGTPHHQRRYNFMCVYRLCNACVCMCVSARTADTRLRTHTQFMGHIIDYFSSKRHTHTPHRTNTKNVYFSEHYVLIFFFHWLCTHIIDALQMEGRGVKRWGQFEMKH